MTHGNTRGLTYIIEVPERKDRTGHKKLMAKKMSKFDEVSKPTDPRNSMIIIK